MKSSREQFEEWIDSEDGMVLMAYGDRHAIAKEAWQASRAAIEIELPSKEDPANFFCEVYDCELVHESLANCGLKVKS